MSIPKISICIPLYNGKAFFKDCIYSVLKQTFEDFEILIIDDCSRDSSYELALSLQKMDQRIIVLQNRVNLGLVLNWNQCLLTSRGKWIKFVFQDDILLPDCLERLSAAEKHDCPLIVGKRDFIFEDESDPGNQFYKSKIIQLNSLFKESRFLSAGDFSQYLYDYIIDNAKSMNLLGEPSNMLIRRDVATRIGLFNPELIQSCDYEYWARIGTNYGVCLVTDTVSKFRIHSNSTTTMNKKYRSLEKQIDLLKVFYDFLFSPIYETLRESIGKNKIQKLYQYALNHLNRLNNQLSAKEQKQFDMFLKAYPVFQSKVYQSSVDYFLNRISTHVRRTLFK